MNVNVLYAENPGQMTDITPIVQSIEHSGDIMQASRKLTLRLLNTIDGKTQAKKILEGREVRFLSENVEQFRGIIFATEINAAGEMSVTAYDENIYLTKNTDTIIFRNKSASDIVKFLCNKFGISMGTIENTGYIIPKQISRNMTLWDMMITALTTTRKQTGKKFVITSREGKLHLLERKSRLTKVILEDGVNILDASYSKSIEDLRNQVKVVGNEDKEGMPGIMVVEKNQQSITKYGLMQHLEQMSGQVKQAAAKQLAKELLKQKNVITDRAELTVMGMDEVIAGTSVYAVQKMTGIQGGFYVLADTHTYADGLHTMSLTLSATDELPQMEYTEV